MVGLSVGIFVLHSPRPSSMFRVSVKHQWRTLHTKMRLKLHSNIDKAIEEAIRRELLRHDDIARLLWWAGSLTRAELMSPASNTLRSLMSEKTLVKQVVSLDLSSTAALVEKGTLSLHQKVVITNGVTVILYTQCMLLLKDMKNAVKKAMDTDINTIPRSSLPRSKNKSRDQSFAQTGGSNHHVWNLGGKKMLKDKKLRLECLDTTMQTPNAHDGFAYNRILMGVGIYSQYEFDEENNLRKQLTHIVQWQKPNQRAIHIEDVTDLEQGLHTPCRRKMKGEVPPVPKRIIGDSTLDMGNCPKLRKVKKSALEAYDNCIIFTLDPRIQRRGTYYRTRNLEPARCHIEKVHEIRHDDKKTRVLTMDEMNAYLQSQFDLQIKCFVSKTKEPRKNKQTRITRKGIRGHRAGNNHTRSTKPSRGYALRSSNITVDCDKFQSGVFSKLKAICSDRAAEESRCSLLEWLLDSVQSRYEASICFLSVLKLATEGKINLKQKENDITVEILI